MSKKSPEIQPVKAEKILEFHPLHSLTALRMVSQTIAGAVSAYMLLVRPWHLHWGATKEECKRALPGDELVPSPRLKATHAITINAPVENIWQWLVQMGQGRGGFYSYDWLENLFGLNIYSTDEIIPEYQSLKVGDAIPLAPNGFAVPVEMIEPNHLLVLHGDSRKATIPGGPPLRPGDFINMSWTFTLEALDTKSTRLIERFRVDWNPSFVAFVGNRVFLEPASFIMERKMLLGIKHRAEQKTIQQN